ncbi:MAG TPA: hypothetical protein PJ982_04185 [Lacipirellulaceae bacterium]|mgnify:CR=1 FL=1|nr:hypothetical protein [Lacipirellulaceae bacterium]
MEQRTLPFEPQPETQAERCRRVLAGVSGVRLGTDPKAFTFTDENYRRATERAQNGPPLGPPRSCTA